MDLGSKNFSELGKEEMKLSKGNEMLDDLDLGSQILIVDDSCFNILALQGLIRLKFDLPIDSATDGQEALQKIMDKYRLTGCTYRLILMDYSMPNMDGPSSAKKILEFLSKQTP